MFGHNSGSSLFSKGSGGLLGGDSVGPRQLTLVPSEGYSGNGMASIGMDNSFSLIAHLPPPHTLSPYAPVVYAAYLVDGKGQNGFYAGTLKAAGNGMYQANFRSPVPLVHYNRVVVSLESPQGIGQAPQGPIVMKVKEGFLDGFGPVKKIGGDMWGRVKGFIGNRFGGNKGETVEQRPAAPAPQGQQFTGQPNYPPQGGYIPQGYQAPQGYQPGPQGGGYPYNAYPRGRGMYPPQYPSQPVPQQPAYVPPVPQNHEPPQIPVAGGNTPAE
ncbi:MAG: hypothetical protein AWM53_01914 [Candidatus Dichloromethanomonas elyunquensis]|nr:MAG: hypothetical protein AWM53_01914 [Candidatus Dichloromethanomonas elyunquensis]